MLDVPRVTRRAATVACVVAVAAGTACSSGDDRPAAGDPPRSGGTDSTDSTDSSSSATTVPAGPFATGRRTLTLVDASRPTDAVPGKLPGQPDRTIEVEVVYPADGEAGPPPTGEVAAGDASSVDAPPAPGVFPLVVFAHGFDGRGDVFRGLAERWAREGYLVALPTFPLSQNGIGVSADLVNQPGDVSFVIDELTGLDDRDPLAGRVDGEHVAVGGHSLGAATVFGVAYNSCCLDDRIDAAIPVAGGSLAFAGGDYHDRPATPMLLVHGVQDETVPIGAGDAMYEQAEPPVWYLRPAEATHVTVFTGEPGRLLNEAVLAFLDAHLRGDDTALEAMEAEVAASGVGDWRVKPADP